MTAGPETLLVKAISKALGEAYPGCFIVKIHGGPYQRAGLPDLFVLHEGRLLAMEVKCPQPGESEAHALGRVTEQQRKCLDEIQAAGAPACAVTSVDAALRCAVLAFGE